MDIGAFRPDTRASALAKQSLPSHEAADRRELVKAVHVINEARLLGEDRELMFGIDRESRKTVLRIVNRETQELIRQIPSEEALRLAESIR